MHKAKYDITGPQIQKTLRIRKDDLKLSIYKQKRKIRFAVDDNIVVVFDYYTVTLKRRTSFYLNMKWTVK